MIATHNQTQIDPAPLDLTPEPTNKIVSENDASIINRMKPLQPHTPIILQSRMTTHHPKAGLNPLVDAAGYLFSVLGKLKQLKTYRQLHKLHKELIQEVNYFQEAISRHGYNAEYTVICRYVLCATFDDLISNTPWGGQGQWDNYYLLKAFNQDVHHHDKFFTIMERTIKEPHLYIDLMEFMYICLSLGYKGQYRATEHSQYQLEQITNTIYKHIRAYRGDFSKTLSPTPLKTIKPKSKSVTKHHSMLFIFFITTCIIMTVFVSLSYLMDVISNEAYKTLSPIQARVFNQVLKS